MKNDLCPCSELEWLPEHYSLEHHPDCSMHIQQQADSLPILAERIRINLESAYGTLRDGLRGTVDVGLYKVPFIMPSTVTLNWLCSDCERPHSLTVQEGDKIEIKCSSPSYISITPPTPKASDTHPLTKE